jgi:predicted nuclease of predicted toxin-antitoxin system
MEFLVDADLPRPTAEVIRLNGHSARDVRDVGLGTAPDEQIAAYAKTNGLCLLTGDFDFADIRDYPPQDYAGIVVLGLPDKVDREFILRLIVAFLNREEIISQLPGHLAIVEPGRIRLRPA